jgi:hypothetical protein
MQKTKDKENQTILYKSNQISTFIHIMDSLHCLSVICVIIYNILDGTVYLINYLYTYDLYSPVHNVLDVYISITWGSGRRLGPGILEFFEPCEMAPCSTPLILPLQLGPLASPPPTPDSPLSPPPPPTLSRTYQQQTVRCIKKGRGKI